MTALLLRLLISALGLLAACSAAAASPYISLQVTPAAMESPPLRHAVADVRELLAQGFPGREVTVNRPEAPIRLILQVSPETEKTVRSSESARRAQLPYPPHDYAWSSRRQEGRLVLNLRTSSAEGALFGLYGLLQEKLDFRFIHPRQTLLPRHEAWPLPDDFSWSARPRFARRGFHLHTLHPIELTEQLHRLHQKGAMGDLREYVDWLVRNGQNVMQLYLLRTVDRETWPRHARSLVRYAHSRGVRVGCMVSVSMLQQKAFQLMKVLRPEPYSQQIDRSLDWLFRVPWDFVSLEYTLGEHLPDLRTFLPDLQKKLTRWIIDGHGARVFSATHVIRGRRFGFGSNGPDTVASAPSDTGVLVHTVMYYAVDDERAPVYGNGDLRFMADLARNESRVRETWFWPESAYWVAFDNSVPLLLLPYLEARWRDMRTMESIGVDGHLTFSSGWEWGYWLTDWSVARWGWSYGGEKTAPLQYLSEIFPGERLKGIWRGVLDLQDHVLKERGMGGLLAAADPFSEMPPPFDPDFQPRSSLSVSWILETGSPKAVRKKTATAVRQLENLAEQMKAAAGELHRRTTDMLCSAEVSLELFAVEQELVRALEVTALRARHRALTLEALARRRLDGGWWRPLPASALALLDEAAKVRMQALERVRDQEQVYRYPLSLVAGRRPGHTAYHFGYLYPVHDLFFWRREEQQVRRGRWDALYMNIWPFFRIMGLESLLL